MNIGSDVGNHKGIIIVRGGVGDTEEPAEGHLPGFVRFMSFVKRTELKGIYSEIENIEELKKYFDGTSTKYCALLFDSLHFPELPSLKESDTGTLASLTIVPHEFRIISIGIKIYLNMLCSYLYIF